MKVLQVCMSRGFGGLELYILNIINYFEKNNNDYHIITAKKSFIFDKLMNINIIANTFSSPFYHLPIISALKLARYIDKNKIDIVHAHWSKDLLFVVLAKIFSRRKIRLVFTRHMAISRKKDDIYHRFLYRHIDVYIVITKELYNNAIKNLPLDESRVHLLYLGVPAVENDLDRCRSLFDEKGVNENIFCLAIFGRIEEGKGQHFVIEAVNNLKKQGHHIQLAMIGHIMDEEYFKMLNAKVKEYNLEKNVFYLGFHNHPPSIMSCFDAVVLATKCETFGLVLPEAMRAGVTVIGSNCGGVPEIIEHEKTGLLFETETPDDLSKQLLKIVDDKNFCSKLSLAGKSDADNRFSEENHFKNLIRLMASE